MTEVKSFRFARNIVFNLGGQFTLMTLNLLLVPVIVKGLGLESYGLYVIIHAAASYLLLGAQGAGGAAFKFSAEAAGRRDGRALGQALAFSLGLSFATWVLLAGGLVLLGDGALAAFNVPAALMNEGRAALLAACFGTFFAFIMLCMTSVLQGLQRFDAHSGAVFFQAVLTTAGTAWIVSRGGGITKVAWWYVAANAVSCGLAAALLRIVWPKGLQHGAGLKRRDFLHWAGSLSLGPCAALISTQVDKMFLALSSSLTSMTLYAVPAGLLQRLQVLPTAAGTVLMPMLSELSQEDESALRRMYLKSVRFVLWAALPVLVVLFAVMPQFLSLWLGGRFGEDSVWPARVLVVGQAFWLMTSIPIGVAVSRGHPLYLPILSWCQAALSLACWWTLIPRYGLFGAALGAALAQALPAVAFAAAVHRRLLRIRFSEFFSQALLAPCASAALLLAVVFPLHAHASDWPRLIGLSAAGAALYYASTWAFLDASDKDLFRRFLRIGPTTRCLEI